MMIKESFIMKLRKRIAAMFTAMMMAVSMMSIGASAYPNAYVGNRAKVVVELNYSSSSTYSNAQGKATAY